MANLRPPKTKRTQCPRELLTPAKTRFWMNISKNSPNDRFAHLYNRWYWLVGGLKVHWHLWTQLPTHPNFTNGWGMLGVPFFPSDAYLRLLNCIILFLLHPYPSNPKYIIPSSNHYDTPLRVFLVCSWPMWMILGSSQAGWCSHDHGMRLYTVI